VKPAYTDYLKARLAFGEGRWQETIRLLDKARNDLRHAPDWSSRANMLLALSYRQVGNKDQELQALRRAINDEPTWMAANLELGAALLNYGKVDEASQALEPLKTARDLPVGYWMLVSRTRLAQELRLPEAERRWEDVDEAIAQAGKAGPRSVEVEVLAGTIREMQGKRQEAIAIYTRALELNDSQGRALALLTRLLLQRREDQKADAELRKFETKTPLTPELAKLGVEAAQGLRDPKLALKRAEQAGLTLRDYRDTLWLARLCDAAGAHAKAEDLLRKSLDTAGHTPDTWIAWMEHLWLTRQRERGIKDLDRMKQELPARRQALTLARCYEALQMPSEAAKTYHIALDQAPYDFPALAYAADFARRAERADDARRWYTRLIDPDLTAPDDYTAPGRRQLAVLLASSDQVKALALLGNEMADQRVRWYIESLTPAARDYALKQFNESLLEHPASADERTLLAQMLESANQRAAAKTLLSELADEHPNAAHFTARLARLLLRMGDLKEAERRIRQLESLEPGTQRARELRAELTRVKKT
jgi:tetratricopeptide (TPR) repeat protein